MAGEIGYNGFRVRVYDKDTNKTLTDCVVIATHNGKKYTLPYDQSHGDNRLEVASVGETDDFTLEVTRDGYHPYATSTNTLFVVQVPLSPKLPVLEQCNKIQKIKDDIKDAIQGKGVACDDVFNSYAARIASISSPKIQEEKWWEENGLSGNGTFEIYPDEGYDAMSSVMFSYECVTINVKEFNIKAISIAKGVTFSISLPMIIFWI